MNRGCIWRAALVVSIAAGVVHAQAPAGREPARQAIAGETRAGKKESGKSAAKDKKSVAYWVEQLRKKNYRASEPLVQAGSAAAVPVAALLTESHPRVRESASRVLEALGAQARPALPEIVDCLKHSDPFIRNAAIGCLHGLGRHAREAVRDVMPFIEDANLDTRNYAWGFLSELANDKALLPAARKVLQDGSATKHHAAWLIWRLDPNVKGGDIIPAFVEAVQQNFGRGNTGIMEMLAWVAPDYPEMAGAVAKIFELRHRGTSAHQNKVLEILPTMGPDGRALALKLIQGALADPKSNVNTTALEVLQAHKLDDNLLLNFATSQLNRTNGVDHSSLALILRRLGPKAKQAAPKLLELARKSPNKLGYYQAILAIDPARGTELIPDIEALRSKGKQLVDQLPVEVLLYQIDGKKERLALVSKVLRGERPYDAAVAAGWARELGATAKQFLPDLYPLLESPDAQARLGACQAIWQINHEATKILPVAIKALALDTRMSSEAMVILHQMGPAAKEALPTLISKVNATTPRGNRGNALNTVMAIDRPTAVRLSKTLQ